MRVHVIWGEGVEGEVGEECVNKLWFLRGHYRLSLSLIHLSSFHLHPSISSPVPLCYFTDVLMCCCNDVLLYFLYCCTAVSDGARLPAGWAAVAGAAGRMPEAAAAAAAARDGSGVPAPRAHVGGVATSAVLL